MQSSSLFDKLDARPQIQVVGICQDDLGADLMEFAWGRGLDRSLRRHWHERRRPHRAVSRGHRPKTRLGVGVFLYHAKAEHEEGNYTCVPGACGLVGRFSRFPAALQPPSPGVKLKRTKAKP